MKITIIALSAAALIATAPAVLAQNVSSKTADHQHKVFKKRPQVVTAKGVTTGYSGASSYLPSAPKDYTYDNSRAGGGGGSGM